MKPEISYFANIHELSRFAAELICQLAEYYVEERCLFTVALAGGSTPRQLYGLLAQTPYENRIPWAHTHLFWGDERYVPADHAESNYHMASQALIDHVPIPVANVHRIPTELDSPEATAQRYEKTLRNLFEIFGSVTKDGWPIFDLILLGMGSDGHTASLFPDSPVLDERRQWVAATPAPHLNPQVQRITLTFPIINMAKNVLFLVAGAEKQPILQTILAHPRDAQAMYPAARVEPRGKLMWFVVKS